MPHSGRLTLPKISAFARAIGSLRQTKVPAARLAQVGRTRHRRLDDVIQEAFQHACLNGDLETAVDLADLLERKTARWLAANGTDKRNSAAQLSAMRTEIARRRQMKANER